VADGLFVLKKRLPAWILFPRALRWKLVVFGMYPEHIE
jgi:hypothetical protein